MLPSKNIFLIVIFLIFSHCLLAQTNFKPGYIITNEGDTTNGFLDSRGDLKNSSICSFKSEINAKAVQYQPGQIKAYRIANAKFYISKKVTSENQEKYLFIEYLVNGIADLYYFRDKDGDHYLIENEDGRLLRLSDAQKTISVEGRNYISNPNKHIGLLKANFGDCMEIQPQLEEAKLNHTSLSQIVENYHGYVCEGEKCIVYQKELPAIKISLAPEVGINITKINFNEDRFYAIFPFKNSLYPTIGLTANILLPRINEKLSFDAGLETGKLSYQAKNHKRFQYEGSRHQITEIIDIDFDAIYIKGTGSIKYIFPRGRIQPFTSLGVGLQRFVKIESHRNYTMEFNEREDIHYTKDIPIRSVFYLFTGKIGGLYNGTGKGIPYANLKFEFAIEEATDETNGSGKLTTLQTTALVVGYFF